MEIKGNFSPSHIMHKRNHVSLLTTRLAKKAERVTELESAPTMIAGFKGGGDYGEVIKRAEGIGKSQLTELATAGRPRGLFLHPHLFSTRGVD